MISAYKGFQDSPVVIIYYLGLFLTIETRYRTFEAINVEVHQHPNLGSLPSLYDPN